jgi:phage-related protein
VVPDEKKVVWIGTSLEDLRDFPKDARHDAGFQLETGRLEAHAGRRGGLSGNQDPNRRWGLSGVLRNEDR